MFQVYQLRRYYTTTAEHMSGHLLMYDETHVHRLVRERAHVVNQTVVAKTLWAGEASDDFRDVRISSLLMGRNGSILTWRSPPLTCLHSENKNKKTESNNTTTVVVQTVVCGKVVVSANMSTTVHNVT